MRLGELLIGCGLISQEQLDWALNQQRQLASPTPRLGLILVDAGWVETRTVDYIVGCLRQEYVEPGDPLGLHLVLSGLISRSQLDEALGWQSRQRSPRPLLGEVLEYLGHCRQDVVDFFKARVYDAGQALTLQNRHERAVQAAARNPEF